MSGIIENVLTGGIPGAVSALAGVAGKILDRALPDPAARAAAELELAKLDNAAFLAQLAAGAGLMQAQAATNTAEAASASLFVAGWRPAVGWICAGGLAIQYGAAPLLTWLAALLGRPIPFPQLDMAGLMPLLIGMLGIGVMRTWEKGQGVARDRIGAP